MKKTCSKKSRDTVPLKLFSFTFFYTKFDETRRAIENIGALKNGHLAFQNMRILYLLIVGIRTLLGSDTYGTSNLNNADPDPQPCFFGGSSSVILYLY